MDLVNLMQSLSVEDKEQKPTSNFKVGAVNIGGNKTDIVYGEFINKYMIIATQFEKVGSLLRVSIEHQANGVNIAEPVYSVDVVLGADNTEQQAAARFIAGNLEVKKPLLIFLCLKNYSAETVKVLSTALLNLINS